MNKNLELFLTFMKIGAFTFGGGYAMIPLIQHEVCDNKHWLNEDDILEVVAIAESTPGPVVINAATFVGSRTAGTLGAVCATLGVVLPSFVIILIIAKFYEKFRKSRAIDNSAGDKIILNKKITFRIINLFFFHISPLQSFRTYESVSFFHECKSRQIFVFTLGRFYTALTDARAVIVLYFCCFRYIYN